MERYCDIASCSYDFMSTITLVKSPPKQDSKLHVVSSEAKNPLSIKTRGTDSWTSVAGLSWIFLEDPLNMED